ncbi:LPD7 domain-containing protein [Caballeronia sp. BCC1704]|uniref:LPD7 domain-containing protein n=1 Tax=Caballeronia sp. BCC1704 TaxID=2676300 RepID=UPI001588BF24|nr:LPD7 domain-containing protein [Caballeronia sp. BCC1704]
MENNQRIEADAETQTQRAETLSKLAEATRESAALMPELAQRAEALFARFDELDASKDQAANRAERAAQDEAEEKRKAKEKARRAEEDAKEDELRKKIGVPPLGQSFYDKEEGKVGGDLSLNETLLAKTATEAGADPRGGIPRSFTSGYCAALQTHFGHALASTPTLESKPELHAVLTFADGTKIRDHGSVVRVDRESKATPALRAKNALDLAEAKGWAKPGREPWFGGSDEFVQACFYESIARGVKVKVFDNQSHLMEQARAAADAAGIQPPERAIPGASTPAPLEETSKLFADANKASKPAAKRPFASAGKSQQSGGGWGAKGKPRA